MKLTLMIEGSASAIAAILASLPQDAGSGVTVQHHVTNGLVPTPPLPTTGAAPAVVTSPLPSPVPLPVAPSDDDDSGPVDTGAPAVDSSGLPWDERIHAKTKATVADGTWRKKRGVDDATVASVEAILRSASPPMPIMAPPVAAAPIPVAPPAPIPLPVAMPLAGPVAAPVAPPPPVPYVEPAAPPAPPMAAPAPAPVPEPVAATPFAGFMAKLAEQMQKPGADGLPMIHADYLAGITNEISAAFAPQGVAPLTVITDIKDVPPMIDYAIALLTRDGRW